MADRGFPIAIFSCGKLEIRSGTIGADRESFMTLHHTLVADGSSTILLDQLYHEMKVAVRAGTLPQAVTERVLGDMLRDELVAGGLLRLVKKIELPAVKRFVVADHFTVGAAVGKRTISWAGEEFLAAYGGRVERNVPARTVFAWALLDYAPDLSIVEILGGVDDPLVETHFAHLFHLLSLDEKDGAYQTSEYGNVAYVRSPDKSGLNMLSMTVEGRNVTIHTQSIDRRIHGWLKNCHAFGG